MSKVKHLFKLAALSLISHSQSLLAEGPAPATAIPSSTIGAEIVTREYGSEKELLQNRLARIQDRLKSLSDEQAKAIVASQLLAKKLAEGVVHFEKYVTLLKTRYVHTETGEYEEGLALSESDVKNINTLFQTYLHRTQFEQSASASEAVKALKNGGDDLEDLVSEYSRPDEDNNSDISIIVHHKEKLEEEKDVVMELASRLNVSLDKSIVLKASKQEPTPVRAPAGRP